MFAISRRSAIIKIVLAIFVVALTVILFSQIQIINSSFVSEEYINSWKEHISDKINGFVPSSSGSSNDGASIELAPLQSGDEAAPGQTQVDNEDATANQIPGVDLSPGNVKIEYVESPDRQGTSEEIVDINMKAWKDATSQHINEPKDFDMDSIRPPLDPNNYKRERATIVSLVRNNEMHALEKTIVQLEAKFNSKFQYPYTFLNEQPFSEKFKDKMRSLTSAEINFVLVPQNLWKKPFNINAEKEKEGLDELLKEGVAYANAESYHNMCRFYSGNFYKVPELLDYRYYWRIEPNVRFFSDINYDVFKYLAGTKKVYGFSIALYDSPHSVKSLFPETIAFLNKDGNHKYIHPKGSFQFITENKQLPKNNQLAGYSTCHFWSNFEIADMEFFRGEAYTKWFEHLDSTGNFYYERWGDAPVHSLGVSLFADKSKVHWFRDIGYFHVPYFNCPNNEQTSDCKVGKFDEWDLLSDQNCLGTWIEFCLDKLVY